MTASGPLHPAAYIRVADAGSAGDIRVQRQREAMLSAAREHGWPGPAVYTGTGPSGRHRPVRPAPARPAGTGPSGWHRPGSDLARLAADIGSGQSDAVITTDLARISRTPADTAAFTAHCASHGAHVETIDDAPGQDPRAAALRAGLTSNSD